MGVYRFKVSFQDNPEISRTIDIVGVQHFEIFHKSILKSVKFDEGELSSFYLNYGSPDQMEIALSDMQGEDFAMLMMDAKIQDIIGKDVQKLTYVYDFMNMWTFDIELVGIFDNTTPNVKYPNIIESEGDAPIQSERDMDDDFDDADAKFIDELMNSNKDMFKGEFEEGEDEDEFDSYSDNDDTLY